MCISVSTQNISAKSSLDLLEDVRLIASAQYELVFGMKPSLHMLVCDHSQILHRPKSCEADQTFKVYE